MISPDGKKQQNNRRNNRIFEKNGLKGTLTFWAKKLNINRSTLAQRFYVYEWDIDRVLQGKEV